MRLGLEGNTPTLVSSATAARMGFDRSSRVTPKVQKNGQTILQIDGNIAQPRLCVLSLREQGGNTLIDGADTFVIFKMNYKSLDWTQGARVQVQQGMSGYVINENGLSEPHFIIQGNGGSVLKSGTPKDNREKGMKAEPQAIGTGSAERKYNIGGQTDPTAMDGQQFWFRLQAVCQKYFETNQARKAKGKPAIEMVWFDPMHGRDGEPGLRWVVVPMAMPTLKRTAETQAVMPFHLDLAGVYDDIKGRQKPLTEPIVLKPAATPKYKPPVAEKTPPPHAPPSATDTQKTQPIGVPYYDTKEWKDKVDEIVENFTPNNPFAPAKAEKPSLFDFRFSTFALKQIEGYFVANLYPRKKHKRGAEDYYRGVSVVAAWLKDDPIWHTEDARKAVTSSDAPKQAKVRGTWYLRYNADARNRVVQNVRRGLTPWGDYR